MTRINIGCGQTPTKGWKNFDNSFSVYLSKISKLPEILRSLRLVRNDQYKFLDFLRDHQIQYADASKHIPVPDGSCDVVYSSHMLEHMGRQEADKFLIEAYRILEPGGIIRLVVPDLKMRIEKYNETGDADKFMESIRMGNIREKTLQDKIRMILTGARHHVWMYDGASLSKLLRKHGFTDPEILTPGDTKIDDPGSLNLFERDDESVYVEAKKPVSIY